MKDINDYTIEELQARIDHLKETENNDKLTKANDLVYEINEIINELKSIGFLIGVYDDVGFACKLDRVWYDCRNKKFEIHTKL